MKKEFSGRVHMLGFDKISAGTNHPAIPGRRTVGITMAEGGELVFDDWMGLMPKYESFVTVTVEYEEQS